MTLASSFRHLFSSCLLLLGWEMTPINQSSPRLILAPSFVDLQQSTSYFLWAAPAQKGAFCHPILPPAEQPKSRRSAPRAINTSGQVLMLHKTSISVLCIHIIVSKLLNSKECKVDIFRTAGPFWKERNFNGVSSSFRRREFFWSLVKGCAARNKSIILKTYVISIHTTMA